MNPLQVRAQEATDYFRCVAEKIRSLIADHQPVSADLMNKYWLAEEAAREAWWTVDSYYAQEWAESA